MAPASPPTTFGKYQIIDRIAVGSMAEIYKARLDGIGGFHRTFAIKRILPHLTAQTEFVDMLVDEAKTAGLLSHANIVQIMDLGEFGGTYYIAMEYVEGPDLGKVLRRCSDKGITLPVPHAVFIALEMLKGLEYAHNRQIMRGGRLVPLHIVHRDVSPPNVLVSFQGEVKLTDFGIAKASVKAQETVSGAIEGRFNYLSPEQLSGAGGHPVDQRADLWSTGVLLYEMLCGRNPFTTGPDGEPRSETALLQAIKAGAYTPASHVNPDVPYPLELVLDQALKVDPAERFGHATAMKEALDRFFHDAGFIFSHSTLAAFLKGLFPNEARTGRHARPAHKAADAIDDQVTRPLNLEDMADERPTAIGHLGADQAQADFLTDSMANADTILRPMPSAIAGLSASADLSRSVAMGPLAGLGDESTLIRNNPLVDDARAWSQAETVIRPDPSAQAASPGLRPAAPPPASAAQPPDPPPRARPAPSPTPPSAPAPQPNAPLPDRRAPKPAPSRTYQLVYLALGAVVTLLILFVGALIGVSLFRFVNPEPAAIVAQANHDPELEVHLPDGADLYIDGRKVAGGPTRKVYLQPGSYEIKVEKAGHTPVGTTIELQDNDIRVITFQLETLRAQE